MDQLLERSRQNLAGMTRTELLVRRTLLEKVVSLCQRQGDDRWRERPAADRLSVREQLDLVNEALGKITDQSVVIRCQPASSAAVPQNIQGA